jgi:hypothetical protein
LSHVRSTIIPALHIGAAIGLDSDSTVTGSCSFQTGTVGADGSLISVGAMMRLEADIAQNRFRLTVRAKHPLIVSALRSIIQAQLV